MPKLSKTNAAIISNKLALQGAIKSEINRNAETLKKEQATAWLDYLTPTQLKHVWELMQQVRDATILDINS